ncbi:cytochrome-c oxidase, cbb3-type subunit I [Rubritalea profundi]|uniref:cytochrome-c oxidase n=1 Tax=Rubritalea profundi TaxID=1658618 RepID=A0A2S7U067_9BACT|nr:cytochrome-c oxidase, cbb3-type subunit I [Rubritalea profundi]PQJ27861.1 cytochrome-c oxidase, cbb3-type subunit I [Rubritalea profundi]
MNRATITYNDKCVRYFLWASIIWALVAMLAGVLAALQMNISMEVIRESTVLRPIVEFLSGGTLETEGIPYITFGRLRPVHTNAAIFAFVGNMMFAGIYYSTQRLCRCRVASDKLTWTHFWLWQLIIVAAAVTLPLGLTQGKEYAELIWPIDLLVAITWLIFGYNFFWTLIKRNEKSLYVSLWFYIATIITITMLYVVNNLQIPTSLTHSYPIFGGVQDALVQWWYGHNAVAFFLTTPILGIMYYFLPKAANRPVYSYRLSIIHFWALVFIYIWAGPHHLLNTALPEWLQILGMLFSVILWAPSWGGMLNGLLTLRGAWNKLQTDPVIKFFAAALTFYGMATFEGPLLSIKAVNALSHYTDWTVGHVHSATLGWNGFMAAGMFYWLAPRLWKTELYSKTLANAHFWIGFVGILLYISALWIAGIGQSLALNETANGYVVKQFVETLDNIQSMLFMRSIGGALYLVGFLLLAYNIFMTCRKGTAVDATVEVTVRERDEIDRVTLGTIVKQDPFAAVLGLLIALVFWVTNPSNIFSLAGIIFFSVLAFVRFKKNVKKWNDWHETITANYLPFTIVTFFAAAIGGAVQIIPNALTAKAEVIDDRLQVVYTPLELEGRDIYVAEGCHNCHSQMIRMLETDYVRYGDYSRLGESIYNYPFQWGSKRTGPDLAREGGDISQGSEVMRQGLRDNFWHFRHFMNPRDIDARSNMPSYSSLASSKTNFSGLPEKIRVQSLIGVPFPVMTPHEIEGHAQGQALEISKSIVAQNPFISWVTPDMSRQKIEAELAQKEIIALIAYMQKIGVYEVPVDEDGKPKAAAPAPWENPDQDKAKH